MRFRTVSASGLLVLTLCGVAGAHPHHFHSSASSSLAAGFAHPWLGWDHLLAMVAIGLWGAYLGGRARWAVPGAFLAAMLGAAALGVGGGDLLAPLGCALTLVLLGAALYGGSAAPLRVSTGAAALCGLLHGHAHVEAAGAAGSTFAFITGCVAATLVLQIAGAIGGHALLASGESSRTTPLARRLRRSAALVLVAAGALMLCGQLIS